MEAEVLADGWHEEADVAFLRLLSPLPSGVKPAILRPSANTDGHTFRALGYPNVGEFQGVWAEGKILGLTTDSQGLRMLPLRAQEIAPGMSGAPVLDVDAGRVVGMVSLTYNADGTLKFRDAAFAIPSETLRDLCPVALELREPEEPPQSLDTLTRQQAKGDHIAQADRGGTVIVGDANVIGDHSTAIKAEGNAVVATHGGVAAGKVAVGGDVHGDLHIGDKIYTRSQAEELRDKELAYLDGLLNRYEYWLEHYTPLPGGPPVAQRWEKCAAIETRCLPAPQPDP
jgi:hypothetical protein